MSQTDDLRRLAEQATPGPWATMRDFPLAIVPSDQINRLVGGSIDPADDARFAQEIAVVQEATMFDGWEAFTRRFDRDRNRADAAYIAAANPTVVLGLLDRIEALEGALRDANGIVAMTRQHLAEDHPDCAYTALGVMNDAGRRALLEKP